MQRLHDLQCAFDVLCMEEIEQRLLEWKPCTGIYNNKLKWPTKTTRVHALVLRAKHFWEEHKEDSLNQNPHGGRNIPMSSFSKTTGFEQVDDLETDDLLLALLRKDRTYVQEIDVRGRDRRSLEAAFDTATKHLKELRQDILVSCIGGFTRVHVDNVPFKTSITVIAGKLSLLSTVTQLSEILSYAGQKILLKFPHTNETDEEMVRRGIRVHLFKGHLTQNEWDDVCSFAIEHKGEVVRISEGMIPAEIDLESLCGDFSFILSS